MPEPADVIFKVQRRDPDDESLTEIGKLAFGAQGQLTLLSAEPAFQLPLANIVATVNGQEALRVKTAPPPEAEPTSLVWRTVQRDDPDLLEYFVEFMEQKYALYLTPEDPAANG